MTAIIADLAVNIQPEKRKLPENKLGLARIRRPAVFPRP